METYILEPDRIGTKTIQHLAHAAKRGCDVKLLYDYIGSSKIGNSHVQALRQSSGEAISFNPLWKWPWMRWGFFRNHRKVLVVDNKVAFCGGLNIGDNYAGVSVGGNGNITSHIHSFIHYSFIH